MVEKTWFEKEFLASAFVQHRHFTSLYPARFSLKRVGHKDDAYVACNSLITRTDAVVVIAVVIVMEIVKKHGMNE